MRRRLNIVALFAIVGLIANLQCYAACFSSDLHAASHAACHHAPDSGQNNSGCGHQHSHAPAVTTLPDNSTLSGAPLTVVFLALPVSVPALEISRNAATQAAIRRHGSPPGRSLFLLLSVLRI
ncbi:MAG TPA: hypothetical protein VN737_13760 [Bryobacteraceae bacterium]|nr:hypothetical protein [Bryobacteraceae bacterium]